MVVDTIVRGMKNKGAVYGANVGAASFFGERGLAAASIVQTAYLALSDLADYVITYYRKKATEGATVEGKQRLEAERQSAEAEYELEKTAVFSAAERGELSRTDAKAQYRKAKNTRDGTAAEIAREEKQLEANACPLGYRLLSVVPNVPRAYALFYDLPVNRALAHYDVLKSVLQGNEGIAPLIGITAAAGLILDAGLMYVTGRSLWGSAKDAGLATKEFWQGMSRDGRQALNDARERRQGRQARRADTRDQAIDLHRGPDDGYR
jgi:hypothetical protein